MPPTSAISAALSPPLRLELADLLAQRVAPGLQLLGARLQSACVRLRARRTAPRRGRAAATCAVRGCATTPSRSRRSRLMSIMVSVFGSRRRGAAIGPCDRAQPQRQREVARLAARRRMRRTLRARAQLAQPGDHLLHQDVGRRRAGGQADALARLRTIRAAGRRRASTMYAGVPRRCASSRSRLLLLLVGLPTTMTTSTCRRQHLDRVLPVLRRVADVLLLRLAHMREAPLHRGQDLGRVVDAQRGLRDHRQLVAARRAPWPRRPRPRPGRCRR